MAFTRKTLCPLLMTYEIGLLPTETTPAYGLPSAATTVNMPCPIHGIVWRGKHLEDTVARDETVAT